MAFLILAILCSTAISVFLRMSNNKEHSLYGKLVCNYATCSLCALLFSRVFRWNETTLVLGAVNGLLLVMSLYLMQLSMKLNGIALTGLYGRLGVCVPLLFSVFLFHEIPTWLQLIGMALSFLSIALFFYQSKINFKLGLTLLVFMIVSGLIDTMSKIYQFYGEPSLASQYFFLSFFMAAILSFILMMVKKQRIAKNKILYGFLIGVPNYLSSYFLLISLNELPSIIVYPMYSMLTIMTISLCGYFFFKEKINKEMMMTFVLIMISIGLLNI